MRLLLLSILLLAISTVSHAQLNTTGAPDFNDDIDDQGLFMVASHNAKLSLYPNPTNGNFSLTLNSRKEGRTQILVLNSQGKVVNYRLIEDPSANSTIKFSLNNLPKGVYFAKISEGKTSETIKFFVGS